MQWLALDSETLEYVVIPEYHGPVHLGVTERRLRRSGVKVCSPRFPLVKVGVTAEFRGLLDVAQITG